MIGNQNAVYNLEIRIDLIAVFQFQGKSVDSGILSRSRVCTIGNNGQTGAFCKRIFADLSHRGRNINLLQAVFHVLTAGKRFFSNGLQSCRQRQRLQCIHSGETLRANGGHAFRNSEAFHIFGPGKGRIADGFQGSRQNDFRQRIFIAPERKFRQICNALRNHNFSALALIEGIRPDILHAGRNPVNTGPFFAAEKGGIFHPLQSGGQFAVCQRFAVVERLLPHRFQCRGKVSTGQIKTHEEGITANFRYPLRNHRFRASPGAEQHRSLLFVIEQTVLGGIKRIAFRHSDGFHRRIRSKCAGIFKYISHVFISQLLKGGGQMQRLQRALFQCAGMDGCQPLRQNQRFQRSTLCETLFAQFLHRGRQRDCFQVCAGHKGLFRHITQSFTQSNGLQCRTLPENTAPHRSDMVQVDFLQVCAAVKRIAANYGYRFREYHLLNIPLIFKRTVRNTGYGLIADFRRNVQNLPIRAQIAGHFAILVQHIVALIFVHNDMNRAGSHEFSNRSCNHRGTLLHRSHQTVLAYRCHSRLTAAPADDCLRAFRQNLSSQSSGFRSMQRNRFLIQANLDRFYIAVRLEGQLAAVTFFSFLCRHILFRGGIRQTIDLDSVIIRDELICQFRVLAQQADRIVAAVFKIKGIFPNIGHAGRNRDLRDTALRKRTVLNALESFIERHVGQLREEESRCADGFDTARNFQAGHFSTVKRICADFRNRSRDVHGRHCAVAESVCANRRHAIQPVNGLLGSRAVNDRFPVGGIHCAVMGEVLFAAFRDIDGSQRCRCSAACSTGEQVAEPLPAANCRQGAGQCNGLQLVHGCKGVLSNGGDPLRNSQALQLICSVKRLISNGLQPTVFSKSHML